MDDNGVTVWRATYDGDGSRRKRLDGKGTIHYLGPYERSVGNGQDVTEVVTKYYTASMGGMSRLLAMRKNGVLAYVGTDHLGGTIRVADSAFAPLDQMRYTPTVWTGPRDSPEHRPQVHLPDRGREHRSVLVRLPGV